MQKKLLVILILGAINNATSALSPVPPKDSDVLDDVIVTATRSEINTAEAPGSVTVITRKEIEKKGGENIVDLIRGTTGINLRGIGTGGRKAISLRGMESKHTLILVDGKRIPSSNDSIGPNTDYQYDWVPSSRIERIEVVRGPMSVLYGADALGGVINIITRKPNDKTQVNITAKSLLSEGTSGSNGQGLDFHLSGRINPKLQATVSAKEFRRGSFASKANPKISSLEGHKKQQASLSLDWQPNLNNTITLDIIKGQEDRWYDTVNSKKKFYQSQYDIDLDQLSLGWKGSIGKTDNSLRAYQSVIDTHNKATNGARARSPQKLTETVVEGNTTFPVGLKHFITTGLEHRNEKIEVNRLNNGKGDVTLKSFYLQDEIDINDNLVLTLGTRLDDHDRFSNEISPRVSIVWNKTDKLIFKASYGHGFHAPSIKQISKDYKFAIARFDKETRKVILVNIIGNEKIQPETNNSFELGMNYATDKYSIDTSIFDNKVDNLIHRHLIRTVTPPAGPTIETWQYDNISKAHLKGFEFSSKINIKKGLKLNTSYQYLDAKDGNGNRLNHRPRHTLSSGITWDKNSWQLSLGAEYLSGQVIEHNNVSTNVPSYTLWNAGVKKSINKHLDLALQINNLTDVRLEDKSSAFLHEEYPRTLKLELRGSF